MKVPSIFCSPQFLATGVFLASGAVSQAHATELMHAQVMLEKNSSTDGTVHQRIKVNIAIRADAPDRDVVVELDTGFGQTLNMIGDINPQTRSPFTWAEQGSNPDFDDLLTFKMKDFDGSLYRYKQLMLELPDNATPMAPQVRLMNVRRDSRSLNVDPNALVDISIPVEGAGYRSHQHLPAMPVIPLTVNQQHEYDIALGHHEVEKRHCRLRELSESGLLSQPTVGDNVLQITQDCKMIWNTTGAEVGSRYTVQFEVISESDHPRVVEQEILIVDTLEGICEGPTRVKDYSYPSGEIWGTYEVSLPPQGPRMIGTFGYSQHDHNYVRPDLGDLDETFTMRKGTPYTIDENGGVNLMGYVTVSVSRHPNQVTSVCPMVYDRTCKEGGPGRLGSDPDLDLVCYEVDNCPLLSNPDQKDTDNDGKGDACDTDMDGDGIENGADNCPLAANADQSDVDEDGQGDTCDSDQDDDGLTNDADNCPALGNPDQEDLDQDGKGDVCDDDIDGDGVANENDECQASADPSSVMVGNGCTIEDTCPCEDDVFGRWAQTLCVRRNSLDLVFQGKISWFTYFDLNYGDGNRCN